MIFDVIIAKMLRLAEGSVDDFHLLAIKYFLKKVIVHFLAICYYILNRLKCNVDITFICTGKPKISVTYFISILWNQTCNISKVCL